MRKSALVGGWTLATKSRLEICDQRWGSIIFYFSHEEKPPSCLIYIRDHRYDRYWEIAHSGNSNQPLLRDVLQSPSFVSSWLTCLGNPNSTTSFVSRLAASFPGGKLSYYKPSNEGDGNGTIKNYYFGILWIWCNGEVSCFSFSKVWYSKMAGTSLLFLFCFFNGRWLRTWETNQVRKLIQLLLNFRLKNLVF